MGGEGSMQHMINVLRSNRSLLRKKNMFKRERSFLSTKKEYYKAAQGKIDLKTATKEELILIRQKILKHRRAENIRAWSIIFIVVTVITAIGIYNFNKAEEIKIQSDEIVKEKYLIENINEYSYFIEEGDQWIEKKN